MNRIFLNDAIKTINTDNNIFSMIITILVGHFSELHGNNGQRFFSKEIFELPIIKEMRKDVKLILHQNNNLEIIANKIIDLIKIAHGHAAETLGVEAYDTANHRKHRHRG